MDITLYVMIAGFVGFVVGILAMYIIVEIAYHREERRKMRKDKSMYDFAEYVAQERRNKQINFDLSKDIRSK